MNRRLLKLEREQRKLELFWQVYPEEVMLDEPAKDARMHQLTLEQRIWCDEQLARTSLTVRSVDAAKAPDLDEFWNKAIGEVKSMRAVRELILAYWWGPAHLSQEAKGHLELIWPPANSGDTPNQPPTDSGDAPNCPPESFSLSEKLQKYIHTDPEGRYDEFIQLRTHDRAAFLATMKWLALYGRPQRRVRAPEFPDSLPRPYRILYFGELKLPGDRQKRNTRKWRRWGA